MLFQLNRMNNGVLQHYKDIYTRTVFTYKTGVSYFVYTFILDVSTSVNILSGVMSRSLSVLCNINQRSSSIIKLLSAYTIPRKHGCDASEVSTCKYCLYQIFPFSHSSCALPSVSYTSCISHNL